MDQDKKITSNVSENNTDIITFFAGNQSFIFAYKKTEKLASAVYMITNLFSENEPMKWVLRKKVSDLVSHTLSYKDVSEASLFDFTYNLRTRVLEIVSLLEVSYRGGLISNMNYSVLKQEFSNLIEVINSPHSEIKEPMHDSLSRTFFDIPESDGSIKDTVSRVTSLTGQVSMSSEKSSSIVKDKISHYLRRGYEGRSSRQNTILSLIKKKGELTIKDISEVIKDCSEKTIQRELISFISKGIVKRIGERRWSKYSLV